MHFTGSSFCNLSWKKESGVSWKPDPPSSLNGGIPANTHVLSHVFVRVMFWDKRGRVGGFGGGLKREGFLPVSKWKTLVSKSGQDGRNSVNRAPERALDLSPRNSGRIDSVYVAGFLSGCRMCVLICINIFFFFLFLKNSPRGLLNPSSVRFGNSRRTSITRKMCAAEARRAS